MLVSGTAYSTCSLLQLSILDGAKEKCQNTITTNSTKMVVNYRNFLSNMFRNAILPIFLSLSFLGQPANINQYFPKSTSPALKLGSKL